MKILVTGGVGFIGSHTVVELQNAGFQVVIIDNLSNSNIEVLDRIEKITGIRPEFEQFNLCEEQKVIEFFKKHSDIKAAIHFAASKAVGESVAKPLLYYKNNLLSLVNLLNTMLQFNISNFVFSSSCTVYGQPDILPVTEEAPIKKAESPYGNTKQIGEEIIYDTIVSNDSLKAICLRYFNPIGAHATSLIGEIPVGVPNNLMPFITQTAIGIRQQLKVYGNDYDTHDGTCIRDYIHVVDLAKAHVIAIKRLIDNKNKDNFKVFNVGTGIGYSVLDVIKSFEKMSGQKLNYQIVDRRAGDIVKIWAEPSLANNELGWKSELSLDDMTLSAWNWEKAYRK